VIGGALEMQMMAGAAGKNKEALEAAGKVKFEFVIFLILNMVNSM